MGLEVLHNHGFWLAIAALPLMGAFNILVSFYLAFRLALRAQNVSNVERSKLAMPTLKTKQTNAPNWLSDKGTVASLVTARAATSRCRCR